MTPPAADPTPGLTNLTASVSGATAWAGCVISEPAYVSNGQVYFQFTPLSDSEVVEAVFDCRGVETYARVSDVALALGTTYLVQAYCLATNGDTVFSENSVTLTTEAAVTPALGSSWLEMPAAMAGSEAVMAGASVENLFTHTYSYNGNRSYTVCYDTSAMTTYWVAYPLGSEHTQESGYRTENWSYVSEISTNCQANVISASYKNAASGGKNNYDRGHLLPSAARNRSEAMNDQTFYVVNIAPQNATFNQVTWSNMEAALRSLAQNGDYLYVVTGTMCPQANDGKGSFTPERTYDNSGKEIPVPRYFYTVALKVDNESNPTSASTIGFWGTNQEHSDSYTNYAVTVDQIEEWTGMDFFVNLPDTIEASAETNNSWSAFQSF